MTENDTVFSFRTTRAQKKLFKHNIDKYNPNIPPTLRVGYIMRLFCDWYNSNPRYVERVLKEYERRNKNSI